MKWLNIDTRMAGFIAFRDSSDSHVATWFKLMLYCGAQENGGRIAGGWNFKQALWDTLAGVKVATIRADSKLWVKDGIDILVLFYPLKQEKKQRNLRRAGHLGGLARARNEASRNASSHASRDVSSHASSHASTKGKGSVSEKEVEVEGKAIARAAVPSEREFIGLCAPAGLPEEFVRSRYAYIEAKGMWWTPEGRLRSASEVRGLVVKWFCENRSREGEVKNGAAPSADHKTVEQRTAELRAMPEEGAA